MRRLLILTSSTGGGHNTRARAFQSWAQREFGPDVSVRIHQALEETHGLYRFGVFLYNRIQRHAPWLHHVYFHFLEAAALFRSSGKMLGRGKFLAVLDEFKPDALLSVHASLNHGFFDLARAQLGRGNIFCATYCGELSGGRGFSRHWVNPEADLFIGAVEETCAAARALGMPADKCVTGGFLLDPSFYEPAPDESARRGFVENELSLDPDRFILLLSTSAMGANNHLRFLQALAGRKMDLQVVALSADPAVLVEQISVLQEQNPGLAVRVLPFSQQMARLLSCTSAVVARPGTGTTSEAILCACPLLHNGMGGVMPQETITLKFCDARQLSRLISSPEKLADVMEDWLNHPEKPAAFRERMKAARPAGHPRDIVRRVLQAPPVS
jgi:processive 1,2-diacylglycerol beta-glucosyltransferase